LDSLELDVFYAGVNTKSYQVGDQRNFNERIINNRNFLLPITIEKGGSTLLLIRAQQFDGDVVELPIRLIDATKMAQLETAPILFDGIYIGVMLVMAVYNLLLFGFLRNRAYLFYVGGVLSTLLMMVSLRGWSYQFLWPEGIEWQQLCFPWLLAAVVVLLIEFSLSLLSFKSKLPGIHKVMRGIQITAVAAAGLTGPIPYWLSYGVIAVSCAIFGSIVLVGGALYLWRQGDHTAGYYLIAFLTFFTSVIIYSLAKLGLVPSSTFTDYSLQFGSFLEQCLFSLALASKIKLLKLESALQLEELTKESLSHEEDIEKFNQTLTTKLFLFGDLAHRVNNPLNVAQGGTEVARTTLDVFTKTVLGFFPVPGKRTAEEQKVVENLEGMAIKIGLSLEDSKAELSRAVAYVQDLRVVGGVNGDSPDNVLLTAVVDKAMERISADLGPKASLFIDSADGDSKGYLMGQTAVLAVALASWLKHGFQRQTKREPLILGYRTSSCGLFCWLSIRNKSETRFEDKLSEEISARDVVMGLLGNQGGQWQENLSAQGEVSSISLRVAATEEAWLMLRGGEHRK
jgi:hypothetical protein